SAAGPPGDHAGLVGGRPPQGCRDRARARIHRDPAHAERLRERTGPAHHGDRAGRAPAWPALRPPLERRTDRCNGAAYAAPDRAARMTCLAPAAAGLALTIPAVTALCVLNIRRPTRIVRAPHLR